MNSIQKVSDITASDLQDYLRIAEVSQDETNTLTNLLLIAKNYIMGYTGLSLSDLDKYPDLIVVVCILVQDMYDNRTLYVNRSDRSSLNSVVTSILEMHSTNLLPSVESTEYGSI